MITNASKSAQHEIMGWKQKTLVLVCLGIITNYQRSSILNNRNLLSHKIWQSEIRVGAQSGSNEGYLPS